MATADGINLMLYNFFNCLGSMIYVEFIDAPLQKLNLRLHRGLWKTSWSTWKLARYYWDQGCFRREYGRSCTLWLQLIPSHVTHQRVTQKHKKMRSLCFETFFLGFEASNTFGNVSACRVGDRSSVYFNVLIQVYCLYALCLWRCWCSRNNNMSSRHFFILYARHRYVDTSIWIIRY